MTEQTIQPSPQSFLRTSRMIWHAMLAIPIVLHMIAKANGYFLKPEGVLLYLPTYLLAFMPMAIFFRLHLHKQGRQEDGLIQPGAYLAGNLILWAECTALLLLQAMMPIVKGPNLAGPVIAYLLLIYHVPTMGKLLNQVDFGQDTDRSNDIEEDIDEPVSEK